MQEQAIDVIGFGALNIDYIYRVDSVVADRETIIKSFVRYPGGSAANTIYALAKLGVNTGFIGAVGGDGGARLALEDFNASGVETSGIVTKSSAVTGVALCLVDNSNRRSLYILPGANSLLNSSDINSEYLSRTNIIHLSSFVDRTQLNIQKEVISKLSPDIKVTFSPGAIYSKLGLDELKPILKRCHVLFVNKDEAEELTGKPFDIAAKELINAGCKIVAITFGEGMKINNMNLSSYISDSHRKIYIEPDKLPKIKIIDTIGAGDAYAAGFIYGVLRGSSLKECSILGEAVARLSLRGTGARSGLPTISELSLFYQDYYHHSLQKKH